MGGLMRKFFNKKFWYLRNKLFLFKFFLYLSKFIYFRKINLMHFQKCAATPSILSTMPLSHIFKFLGRPEDWVIRERAIEWEMIRPLSQSLILFPRDGENRSKHASSSESLFSESLCAEIFHCEDVRHFGVIWLRVVVKYKKSKINEIIFCMMRLFGRSCVSVIYAEFFFFWLIKSTSN